MKYLSFLILFIAAGVQSQAKVWRINNNVGVTADFTDSPAALASASVLNDDTLHFEASATAYQGFTLSKRLVIIGAGYFLSGTNSNAGLQANPNTSRIGGYLFFDSVGSGSKLMGLSIDNFVPNTTGSATDNITLTRCNISGIFPYNGYVANTKMTGWVINKCHIGNISLTSFLLDNWQVTNNIFTGGVDMNYAGNINLLVRNNVMRSSVNLYNTYFSNNLITGNVNIALLVNTTIKNNISSGTNLPAGNGNVNSQSDAAVFQGLTGNSTDGQWRLKAGSPAIGAGETIASITPDCGAYGTADPYVLSGIPAIPTVYALTVPASVPSNATSMSVTISTKSNN